MAFENLKSTGIKYVLTKLKDYFLQIKDAVKSVNGEEPDEDGNITINTVPYAQNLESESSHRNYDTFIQRTSGGESSVENGDAWLMAVKGNNEHTGYVAESLDMTVTALGEEPITATLNRDTFVAYVATSGTTTLVYSTAWSADPTLYGVTVTGTPVAGDTITIVYVKEVRGTITVSDPQTFVSTGWNLYNHSNGYAKVCKYEFGYRIEGTYTSIKFATTPTGTQSDITVNDGNFNIPSDGYVIITGGNSTDTAVYASWEDWTEGYTGDFKSYTQSVVDLSTVMTTYFPYGLLKAGSSVDEIDLNLGQAISRVERMGYTDENLATAKASGREYEYDENYIYLARETATSSSISVDGDFNTDDHGIEFFTGTDLPVYAELLYGNNLKNKLERDVVTKSGDIADNLTTNDNSMALSAKQGKVLNETKAFSFFTNTSGATVSIQADIHSAMATIRPQMQTGAPANYAYYNGTSFFYGEITRSSSKVIKGIMHKANSADGFVFSDSSDDSTATLTTLSDPSPVDISDSVALSSTQGTISDKTIYKTGALVSVVFSFKASAAIAANTDITVTATYTDNNLKNVMRSQIGGSNRAYLNRFVCSNGNFTCATTDAGMAKDATAWINFMYIARS